MRLVSRPSARTVPAAVGVKNPPIPAPPARIASTIVPCGITSNSIAPDCAAATASGLLVKNEPIAFLIWPFRNIRPPAQTWLAHIIGNVSYVANIRLRQGVQDLCRISGHAEAAYKQRVPCLDKGCRLARCDLRVAASPV